MSEELEVSATPESEAGVSSGGGAAEPVVTVDRPADEPELKAAAEETPEKQEKPAYVPNYKFSVSKKEKEFDEFIRSSIKDKDTEEKVRKLYTDAYGMEAAKPHMDFLRENYPKVEAQYNELNTTVNKVLDLKDKDLGLFFEALRLPEEAVAQWMLDKIKKMELPPEQRQVYDKFEETRKRNLALEEQFQSLETRTQELSVRERTRDLDMGLQIPEVSAFVQSYDAAWEKPGAFRDKVIEYGRAQWRDHKKDVACEEAIQAVMSEYGRFIKPTATGTPPGTLPVVERPLPVIPRLSGKAVSSAGKQIRSIADIKRRSEELSG